MARLRIAWLALAVLAGLAVACGDAATPASTAPGTTATSAPASTEPPATAPPSATTAPTTSTVPATTVPTATTVPAPGPSVTELAANDSGMTLVARDESAAGDGWEVSVTRPILTDHPDRAAEGRINAEIALLYDTTVEAFYQDLDLLQQDGDDFRYDVSIEPEVTLFDDEVLSLRFYLFWSSSTAAHPTDDIETLLVELASGEPYSLPDLLSADSAPSALLTLIDRHLLEDVLGGDEDFFQSVVEGRDEPAYGSWALTPGSFDVSYGRYEAGPGVLGSFTISIPYEELGVLVNPNGPIARLAAP